MIALKRTGNIDRLFSVSTFVKDEISINAAGNYLFQLSDMNRRIAFTVRSSKGIIKMNITNLPAGIYVIRLFSNKIKETERIIKQ